jgi:hypothetical protein
MIAQWQKCNPGPNPRQNGSNQKAAGACTEIKK